MRPLTLVGYQRQFDHRFRLYSHCSRSFMGRSYLQLVIGRCLGTAHRRYHWSGNLRRVRGTSSKASNHSLESPFQQNQSQRVCPSFSCREDSADAVLSYLQSSITSIVLMAAVCEYLAKIWCDSRTDLCYQVCTHDSCQCQETRSLVASRFAGFLPGLP